MSVFSFTFFKSLFLGKLNATKMKTEGYLKPNVRGTVSTLHFSCIGLGTNQFIALHLIFPACRLRTSILFPLMKIIVTTCCVLTGSQETWILVAALPLANLGDFGPVS